MSKNNRISSIKRSSSFNSSRIKSTLNNSILTSTKNQEETSEPLCDRDRRRALIPTPHRPLKTKKSVSMNQEGDTFISKEKNIHKTDKIDNTNTKGSTIEDDNTDDELQPKFTNMSVLQVDDRSVKITAVVDDVDGKGQNLDDVEPIDNHKRGKIFKKIITQKDITKPDNEDDLDNQSQMEQNNTDDNFDTFILEHFIPFSGQQNVIRWLDETEYKFNQYRINRTLRFQAISLLVEGDAKRNYIRNRKDIQSFDDFYDFLLSQYDTSNYSNHQSKSNQSTTSSKFLNVTDVKRSIHQLSPQSSTAIADFGTTNVVGDVSVSKSTITLDNSSSSILDQTKSDLRKAIVNNLIKNPKTFKGGQDNVKKWLDEIEHLFDVAHIPDSTRLDLIAYCLRGDALEWFKNNRSTLTLWKVFTVELKKAFTSSFHEELAFQKLESYTQGENQSIRNFYTEVLKLCKEADSTMSESTKLKNLLNKTKPSIQLEVRKKKPTSTTEFLEYAKEAEELFQLSNLTSETNINSNTSFVKSQAIPALVSTPLPPINYSFKTVPNNNPSPYPRQFEQNYNPSGNRNSYSNSRSSNNRPPSFSYNQSNQNRPRYSTTNSQYNQNKSSFDSNNNYRPKSQQQQTNTPRPNNQRPPTANTINPDYSPSSIHSSQEFLSSVNCTRCNQLGHEVSACPNF